MAPWPYGWQLGSLTLADVASGVRIQSEGGSAFADAPVRVPGLDGGRLDDAAPLTPLDLALRTILRWTAADGSVTHADGEAGHIYENLSKVKAQLAGPGLATLKRTVPHIGTVRALCKLLAPPVPAEQRHIYLWFLTVPSGSWQDDTESNSGTASTTPSVTTGGDRRIHDPNIRFDAAGTLTHTRPDGVVETVEVTSGPTFPVTVHIAGTDGSGWHYAEDNGGADVTGDVVFSHPWGLRFPPGTTLSLSADVNVVVYWRNRWA